MESEEPMDVDAGADYDRFDDLLEEGEYEEEESNRVSRKAIASVIASKDPPPSKYENKGGSFITGVDIFSKESKEKLEERAKRFNLTKTKESFALEEAENLYESFGMNDDNIRDYRLNVIHMRGTENMSTEEVFDYFKKYAPASLEWINDVSCNVVWLDNPSAVRAMLGLSKKITGIKKDPRKKLNSDNETEDDSDDDLIIVNGIDPKEENTIHIKDIRCPLPPGIWRKGNNYHESRNIFLRFAMRTDKKGYHAERMSEYYKKHGNPNYGGVKGILTTSRKRAYRQIKETSPTSNRESSLNGIAAKNPWGTLSKNWGRTDFVEREYVPKEIPRSNSNVKERLGYRRGEDDDDDDDDDDSDVEEVIELSDDSESRSSSDEWSKRSKMPRMRMHADDEEQNIQKRKGKIRKLTEKIVTSDLRGRLTARRRLPPVDTEAIQVVVTNPKAIIKSDFSNIDVTEDEEEEDDDVQIVGSQDDDDEEEEGEILEESESDGKVEYEDDDDDEEQEQQEEEEEEEEEEVEDIRSKVQFEEESSDSSLSEKEVRGPKGSVIKVVQRKPKLASTVTTVWSRLNDSKNNRENSPESKYPKRDLRHTLKKTDLRSRIRNHHTRGRSPLRIELKNDKYSARQDSDSD
ncbi:nuclear cap-binding protein subunit 3-like [Phymastichus coffea]|uniref:nuclear cap-binding protein subunit 3-like n=1 Tax=Phymastichus coffea TaxID=108790 RepID=UPI00273CB673|nr:nuclear cap-binding protein subunit 3-like [Phymastichus coffea]XP_058795665.1 nuclear cap-binding protein subunit 3-like [Phymastichus coffea]